MCFPNLNVVCFAGRLYAMQNGMEIDKKSKDCRMFFVALMDHLESVSFMGLTELQIKRDKSGIFKCFSIKADSDP